MGGAGSGRKKNTNIETKTPAMVDKNNPSPHPQRDDYLEYRKTITTLEEKIKEIEKQYEELQKQYENKEISYEELQKQYEELQKQYEELQKQYEELQKQYEELQKQLKEEHLKWEHPWKKLLKEKE
jgi:chromosome segregation ATPase